MVCCVFGTAVYWLLGLGFGVLVGFLVSLCLLVGFVFALYLVVLGVLVVCLFAALNYDCSFGCFEVGR